MHQLLTLFPSDRLGAIRAAEPLTQGLSGAFVHAVSTAQGEFVLRVQPDAREVFRRALPFHRLAAAHGVAPQIFHVDEAACATVSARVKGGLFAGALADPGTRGAAVASLVAQLKTLQALPVAGLRDPTDPAPSARALWDEQSGRPGFPAWALPLGERLAAADAALAADPRRVFCHGDLNPANMLWDGARVRFVDWDVANLGHPYADLATVTAFLGLDDAAALGLVAALAGGPVAPADRELFGLVRDRVRLAYGCVFLRLVPELAGLVPKSRAAAPTLAECFAAMRAGTLDNKAAAGQALLASAVLAQVAGI